MNLIFFISSVITIVGSVLIFFVPGVHHRNAFPTKAETSTSHDGSRVLYTFFIISFLFMSFAVWRYWPEIVKKEQNFVLGIGLLLIMIFGMFIQVITSNYRESREILAITSSQLLFPLLLSPIVFFPIWAGMPTDGIINKLIFYTAFLNGFFWETAITTLHAPRNN